MKINYEYCSKDSDYLKTVCPHNESEKVGNLFCISCKHNVYYSYNKKCVECAFPEIVIQKEESD